MDETRKAEAIAAVRRELSRRIGRFCTSLTPDEFDQLLDQMAYVQWKYESLPGVDDLHHPGMDDIHHPGGSSRH
jgi:hypothetical protein